MQKSTRVKHDKVRGKNEKVKVSHTLTQKTKKILIIERPIFLVFTILLLTFIAFYPSLKNDILKTWDDSLYITDNQIIHLLNIATIHQMFTTTVAGSYVPVPLLTYAVEYKFFGPDPFIFHLNNLLLHLICIFLVFYLFRLLKISNLFAAIAALFFGIHPMHVESVAWISERKDLLYCLFYLTSLVFYIKSSVNVKLKLPYYLLSLVLFILSLFSKITAVTLPVILILLDYYLKRPIKINLIIEKIPFFVVSLIFGIAEIIIFKINGILKSTEVVSFTKQILLGLYAFSDYIIKFIAPFNLSIIYPDLFLSWATFPLLYYFGPILIAILGYFIYLSSKRNRVIAFGSLFFFINLVLVIPAQILTNGVGFLADRFSYLPYLGICFIVGWCSDLFIRNHKNAKLVILFVLGFFILTFSVLTFNRSRIWKDDVTMWNDAISKYPDGVRPYVNRGVAFLNLGQWDNAITDFSKVIGIYPKFKLIYTDRGIAYQHKGQWNDAINDFTIAIENDSTDFDAFNGRGVSYGVLGQVDKAIPDFSKTVQLNPHYKQVYSNRGHAYASLGLFDKAIADYSKAIEIDPEFPDPYSNRSIAYANLKEWDKAIADINILIKMDPGNARNYDKSGYYNLGKGDFADATDLFRKCLSLDERSFDALLGLAVISFYNGDMEIAKKDLEQAKVLEPKLNNGMNGVYELQQMGYFKAETTKENLNKMFEKLK